MLKSRRNFGEKCQFFWIFLVSNISILYFVSMTTENMILRRNFFKIYRNFHPCSHLMVLSFISCNPLLKNHEEKYMTRSNKSKYIYIYIYITMTRLNKSKKNNNNDNWNNVRLLFLALMVVWKLWNFRLKLNEITCKRYLYEVKWYSYLTLYIWMSQVSSFL